MTQDVRQVDGQLNGDTTAASITISGETRTPTGVIIFAGNPTAQNSNTNDAYYCAGWSDFTTEGCVHSNLENGVTPTDGTRGETTADCIFLFNVGLTTTRRSASIASQVGGFTITANENGDQIQFWALVFFETACTAFNLGNGTAADSTFNAAHSMSNRPGIVIGSYVSGQSDHFSPCIGFCSYQNPTITQGCIAIRGQNNQTDGESHGQVLNNRFVAQSNNSGGILNSVEITDINDTNVVFTAREGTLGGNVGGLIVEADEIDALLQFVDGPNSNSADWDVNGFGWEPQCVILGMTNFSDYNSQTNDNEDAGSFGVCAFTDDGIHSITTCDENGSNPSDTATRIATELYLFDHNGSIDYQASSPSFTTDGFQFAAANIDVADTNTHRWLAFGIRRAAAGTIVNRVLHDHTVITDAAPGTQLKSRPGDRVESLVDSMVAQYILGRGAVETISVEEFVEINRSFARQLLSTLSPADTLALMRQAYRQLSDFITTSDNTRRFIVHSEVLPDSLAMSEVVRYFKTNHKVLLDSINVQDFFTRQVTLGDSSQTYVVVIDEVVSVIDTPTLVKSGTFIESTFDSLSAMDFIVFDIVRNLVLSDTIDVTDNIQTSVLRPQLITDSFDLTDSLLAVRRRFREQSEAIDANDTVAQLRLRNRVLVETITLFENVLAERGAILYSATLSDALSVTDFVAFETGTYLPEAMSIDNSVEQESYKGGLEILKIETGIQ